MSGGVDMRRSYADMLGVSPVICALQLATHLDTFSFGAFRKDILQVERALWVHLLSFIHLAIHLRTLI